VRVVLFAPSPACRYPSVAGGEGEGGYEAVPRRRGLWERRGAGGEASGGCGYCKENSNHERRKALVSLKRTPFLLVEDALLAPY